MAADLNNLPDVEFASKDINTILSDMISGYEEAYYEQTGVQKTLYPGDPIRIFLYAQALREFQLRALIDFSAKQNLLKYSSGYYLDSLAASRGVERLQASKATVTIKFILSTTQPVIVTIPKSTRVSPGGDIYFQTTENIEIPAGTPNIDAILECVDAESSGNDFTPGQINILVDPLPWISSVTNMDTSQGGSDAEDDDSFRERIRLAPEGYSVAGPTGAYEYLAKQYNSSISDVKVSSPSAGTVDIRVLLQNGVIPDSTFLTGLKDYLSDKSRRPLTDNVTVNAPDTVSYDITLTYYILTENAAASTTIQANVNQAVQDYITWQKSKIGRDINPSELISMIMAAGARRVNLTNPTYTVVNDTQIAVASVNVAVTYGGLEDD